MAALELVIKDTKELTVLELLEIMKARVKVFVVEQNCPYQEVDEKDAVARHIYLKDQEKVVAYTRIVPHEDANYLSFGRVLVDKSYRKEHLGKRIVAETLAEIKRLEPQRPVKISAQNYLRGFYGSFGFQAVSDVYLEDNIPHLDMVLTR